jgi:hypothetical protein
MSLATIESGIVGIAKKIKAGIELAGEDALKLAGFLQANQAEITGLAALAGSKTSSVVTTGQTVLGAVIGAVKTAGDAASANGLSITFDATVIAAVKAVIKDLEAL